MTGVGVAGVEPRETSGEPPATHYLHEFDDTMLANTTGRRRLFVLPPPHVDVTHPPVHFRSGKIG
jgi:hypothetical protein